MATVCVPDVYTRGHPKGCEKEWYHGELSRVEAEQALATFGQDCFLIRSDEGALVLSLIHHGQLHHVKINYGRGWYDLEIGSARYTLTGLEELVSYYCSNEIGMLLIKLGVACARPPAADSSCNVSIAKEELEELIKHNWFHGNIIREQAEAALREHRDNGFLVRVAGDTLVLSKKIHGWRSHDVICYTPKGYRLDCKEDLFQSVREMIAYYQQYPIEGSYVLGTAIATVPSVQQLQQAGAYEPNFFGKGESTLNMQWKNVSNLPVAISAPQVVKIRDSVYVSGGMRRGNSKTIYEFDKTQETWTALPPCPTSHHALTTLNSELIAVGGKVNDKAVNTIYSFISGQWIEVHRPMPTARYLLAAVSHDDNRYLVAAGGETLRRSSGEAEVTTAVEVYFRNQRTWYRASPLPFSICTFSMCIIGEMCYVLGGTGDPQHAHVVLSSTISSLDSTTSLDNTRASQQHLLPWQLKPQKHPLCCSTPMELGGKLLTVGGSTHSKERKGTNLVTMLDDADTWMECKGAQLPVPLYRAGVVKLDSDQVMIVGGQTKMQQFSAAVYIGKCYKARKKRSTTI